MGRICRGVLTLLQMVESESVYIYLKTRKHVDLSSLRHRHLGADQSESDLKVSDFQMPCGKLSTSRSIPRIDLYVYTGVLPSSVTCAHILSSLEM